MKKSLLFSLSLLITVFSLAQENGSTSPFDKAPENIEVKPVDILPRGSVKIEPNLLIGKWKVSDIVIKDNDAKTPSGLQKENSFFGFMMFKNLPVEFKKDGTVEIKKETSQLTWKYEINGDEIKFISVTKNTGQIKLDEKVVAGEAVMFTVFRIERTGNKIIISRTDPEVSEAYIFEQ